MKTFAGKTAASADKVRGGYYTPAAVARFLAGWVREAGEKILEPSCGDGRILRELAALTGQAHGVELVAHEAAQSRLFAHVGCAGPELARDVVDRHVLIDQLGWSPDAVAQRRSAWVVLRVRRTKRGSRWASAKWASAKWASAK